MARKSKILEEHKKTLAAVLHALEKSGNFYQLMLDMELEDVSRIKWNRWLSGTLMAEDIAAKIVGYAIKQNLLDNNNEFDSEVEENAILLVRFLDPRIQDVIDGMIQHRVKVIDAADVIRTAWRRQAGRGAASKSTLIQDLEKIVSTNKEWITRAKAGDRQIMSDAVDYLMFNDSKNEIFDVMNQHNETTSLTRYEIKKRRARSSEAED